MQSALDISNLNETKLVPASELKAMTVSKEDLFKRQKESIIDSVMSSMITVATEQGALGYRAQLHAAFDKGLLAEISQEFTGLGYSVQVEETPATGPMPASLTLDINWK